MPRQVRLLLLATVLPALAAGCGGGTTASPSTATGTPSASPTSSPAGATARPSKKTRPTRTASHPTARPTPSPTPKRASSQPPRVSGRYTFPVRCSTSYSHSHHDYPATDIFAARGCHFVAPVDGRVDEVGRADNWDPQTDRGADRGGRFVSIVGSDGVRYYGSHLDRVAAGIGPGETVHAGDLLGYVGNSGNARGIATHVHFGLSWPTRNDVWWVRRGEVYPWPYLDSWRGGGERSPSSAVAAEHRRQGDVPPCPGDC